MILSIDPFDTFGLCACDKIVYGCVLYCHMASCEYFHHCDICDLFDLMNACGCACDLNKGCVGCFYYGYQLSIVSTGQSLY